MSIPSVGHTHKPDVNNKEVVQSELYLPITIETPFTIARLSFVGMAAKDVDLSGLPTAAPAAPAVGRLRFADVSFVHTQVLRIQDTDESVSRSQ